MQAASEKMEFERAAALRDRIRAMTSVQTAQGINPRTVAEADIIALIHRAGPGLRAGVLSSAPTRIGATATITRASGTDVDAAEVLEAFIGQFYDTKEPPRQDHFVQRN